MNEFQIKTYEPFFEGKKILIGVTGSIAAYKTCELVRLLKKAGAHVRVIMTEKAELFIHKNTLSTLSQNEVLVENQDHFSGHPHIDLARWADLFVIAPMTADTMAKLAQGRSHDWISSLFLAHPKVTICAPAMNPEMWHSQTTQENFKKLKNQNLYFLEPESGDMSCGENGKGRMLEPEKIFKEISKFLITTKKEKKILLSLGATRSYLDPVRFFSNPSSGKMGSALVLALAAEGYQCSVLEGFCSELTLPNWIDKKSTIETEKMAEFALKMWKEHDLYIGAAAVADLEFEKKMNKAQKSHLIPIEAKLSFDIIAELGKNKTKFQRIFGFAALEKDDFSRMKEKYQSKKCDWIFANRILENDLGFDAKYTAGTLFNGKNELQIEKIEKTNFARYLARNLDQIWKS